jgi:hypothetical protein
MALQTSGSITMNQIRGELGISTQAPFSLDMAENGEYVAINQCSPNIPAPSNPAAMSEWYGYCHTCTCGYSFCLGYSATSCSEACTAYTGCS